MHSQEYWICAGVRAAPYFAASVRVQLSRYDRCSASVQGFFGAVDGTKTAAAARGPGMAAATPGEMAPSRIRLRSTTRRVSNVQTYRNRYVPGRHAAGNASRETLHFRHPLLEQRPTSGTLR